MVSKEMIDVVDSVIRALHSPRTLKVIVDEIFAEGDDEYRQSWMELKPDRVWHRLDLKSTRRFIELAIRNYAND